MYQNIMREIGAHRTSITKVARKIGCNRNTLAAKINERRQFTINEIQLLSDLFGKPIEYLVESDKTAAETKN